MKKEEVNISSCKRDITVRRVPRPLCFIPYTLYFIFTVFILTSCHYPRPDLENGKLGAKTRDSLAYLYERHYTWNTNLEVQDDSVTIACLPVKDCYNTLYKGDRVVVAELPDFWSIRFDPASYPAGDATSRNDEELAELLYKTWTVDGYTEENINEVHNYIKEHAYGYGLVNPQVFSIWRNDLNMVKEVDGGISGYIVPSACQIRGN